MPICPMRTSLIAAALLVACAGRADTSRTDSATSNPTRMTDSIIVRTDKQSYRAGETVQLTIVNNSAAKYTYNPCTRIVERDSAGSWTPVREDRMCTMIAHLLEPKQTRTEATEMAEGIAPGRYRLVLSFADDDPAKTGRVVSATTGALTVAP
jgi:hypothetical protein